MVLPVRDRRARGALSSAGPGLSALALVAVWLVSTTRGPFSADRVNDLYVYGVYHDLLHAGQVPFRDFGFEYPPLALVPIGLAGSSRLGLSLLMLACALACQALARAMAGPAAGWLLVALPVVAGALVRTHVDLLASALTLGGMLLVLRDRPAWGLGLLGAGTMTKLWPAAVAAVALAWLAGRGERGAVARGAVAFAAVVAVLGVPFAILSGFPGEMVRFHLHRPVQIESTAASVLELLGGSFVTGDPVRPDPYKSNGLDGGAADVVLALTTVAMAAVLVTVVVLAARRSGVRTLVLGAFAATLAFVALGKVLSPQYLCWLLPLAAVAWGHGGRLGAALVALAALATQLWFPNRYFDLVDQRAWAIAAVAVRNALLLAALGATVRALARSPRRAGAAPRPG